MSEKKFKEKLDKRIKEDKANFWTGLLMQKAYYIGAYAKAIINGSWNSEISKHNETFKKWLSNQIINAKNLDRIFEMAFRFEQKLKIRVRNEDEVRRLAHEVPSASGVGISSAKVSFAFVAGFDDYGIYVKDNPIETKENKKNENNKASV
jgi:hypothetical protein